MIKCDCSCCFCNEVRRNMGYPVVNTGIVKSAGGDILAGIPADELYTVSADWLTLVWVVESYGFFLPAGSWSWAVFAAAIRCFCSLLDDHNRAAYYEILKLARIERGAAFRVSENSPF